MKPETLKSAIALPNGASHRRSETARRSRRVIAASALALGAALFGAISVGAARPARADAIDRLQPDYLRARHAAIEALKHDRRDASLPSHFVDYRGVMHVHSLLSHDSRSTVAEIVAAANKTGVKFVCFSEHPSPKYDYYKDGHHGTVGGVLLLPGAEEPGLLTLPMHSVVRTGKQSPQEKVDAVRATGGEVFLCHLEERMDWNLKRLTGSEIYNVHADFKDETRLIKALGTPLGLLQLLIANRSYPQETFASLLDYPADYLRRYDELCRTSRLTGIAANDAHHNQGFKGIVEEDGGLRLEDPLGEKLGKLDAKKTDLLKPFLTGELKKGDVAFRLDLDPYERSFTHVSTHLFLTGMTETAVREALKAGRAYVSFEWIADPTGFNFQAVRGGDTFEMGSEPTLGSGLILRSVAPLPARFRLIRNGAEVHSALGRKYEHPIHEAGNYRLEVWVNLADSPQIWILSNPIYVRG